MMEVGQIKLELDEDGYEEQEIDIDYLGEDNNFSTDKDPLDLGDMINIKKEEMMSKEEYNDPISDEAYPGVKCENLKVEDVSIVEEQGTVMVQDQVNKAYDLILGINEDNVVEKYAAEDNQRKIPERFDRIIDQSTHSSKDIYNFLGHRCIDVFEKSENIIFNRALCVTNTANDKDIDCRDKGHRNDNEDCVVNVKSIELTNSNDTSNLIRKEICGSYCDERYRFNCDVCGKSFAQISRLKQHKLIHSGEKPFTCDVCQKSFTTEGNLKTHKRTHTGQKPFSCDICLKSFTMNWSLKNHKRNHHSDEKDFICRVCEKSFSQLSQLKRHECSHAREKPFVCDICDKSFSQSSILKDHKRTHSGDKPFVCDICEKSFLRLGNLEDHKRSHTGEKPFVCDVCKKSFAALNKLKTHKHTHTGEKPFVCDICEKSFLRPGYLREHKRTHTGEKPFICDICEKSFSQSGTLKSHKRTHTKEKPFSCNVCEKSFTQSSALKSHKRTHAG